MYRCGLCRWPIGWNQNAVRKLSLVGWCLLQTAQRLTILPHLVRRQSASGLSPRMDLRSRHGEGGRGHRQPRANLGKADARLKPSRSKRVIISRPLAIIFFDQTGRAGVVSVRVRLCRPAGTQLTTCNYQLSARLLITARLLIVAS